MGLYVMLAHPVEKLPWNLHERLFGQQVWIMLEVVEGHKLHNICSHILAVGARVQSLVVAIKCLHRVELGITNADNNDAEWILRASHDLIDCLVHIGDHTISDNHQNVELLVHLGHSV